MSRGFIPGALPPERARLSRRCAQQFGGMGGGPSRKAVAATSPDDHIEWTGSSTIRARELRCVALHGVHAGATRGVLLLAARRGRGFAAPKFVSRCADAQDVPRGWPRRHKLHHDDGRAQPQLAQGSLNTYEGAGGWRRESSNAKMTTGGATRARAWGVRVCVAPCTSQTAEIGY